MPTTPRPAWSLWYGLPNLSMAMLWTPLNVMQGIYIKHYGLSMGAMATILVLSRIYDAGADLAAGVGSDWDKRRTGTRKRLVAIGGALFTIAALFLYQPPLRVTPLYVGGWLFLFFSGYAILMISHLAWGADIARDSHAKTALFSGYKAAGYVGLCLFYAIPLLPMFASTEITPQTMQVAVLTAVAILIPALSLCLWRVPNGSIEHPSIRERHSRSTRNLGQLLVQNRPFMMLMAAYVLSGTGLGIWYGLIFVFIDIYLHKGGLYAPLYLIAFAAGIPAALAWSRIARVIGKRWTWCLGTILLIATVAITQGFSPGNATGWSVGLLLIVNTVGFASFELIPGSILADVADFSRLKSGHNDAAMYFALYMFVTKAVFALGAAIGLGLAARWGFDPHAWTQTPRGMWAMDTAISVLPGALLLLGLAVIPFIPMDERRHAIVRKRLDLRDRRAACNSSRCAGHMSPLQSAAE